MPKTGRAIGFRAGGVAWRSELLPRCALANANRLLVHQTDFTEEPSQHRYAFST
jgi:hypothetical protein